MRGKRCPDSDPEDWVHQLGKRGLLVVAAYIYGLSSWKTRNQRHEKIRAGLQAGFFFVGSTPAYGGSPFR